MQQYNNISVDMTLEMNRMAKWIGIGGILNVIKYNVSVVAILLISMIVHSYSLIVIILIITIIIYYYSTIYHQYNDNVI